MRDRVRFMIDSTLDGNADPIYDEKFVGRIPCAIHDKTGGERFRGRQLQAETTVVIEMRWIPGLKPTMQAVNEVTGATYSINRILREDARNQYVLIEGLELG